MESISQVSGSTLVTIFLVLCVGFISYISIVWSKRSESWSIGNFYLGGRNIGSELTEHVYWGTSFSLANGIYYFAILGYYNGLAAFWLQVPWVLAIWFLAYKLETILEATEKHTLHGFIGAQFGSLPRRIASYITILGFLGAFAFEVYVSVEIIFVSLGLAELIVPMTFAVSIFVAGYCDIGGFGGTALTDRMQNIIGTAVIVFLVYGIFQFPDLGVNSEKLELSSIRSAIFDFSDFSWVAIFGILCFASTFNIVDMSNWQAISANTKEKQVSALRWAMVRATIWVFILPAFVGCFIGYVWRGSDISTDAEILPRIISAVFPEGGVVGGIFLGLVVLGLAGLALSTADSLLIASVQTTSWDLKHFDLLEGNVSVDSIDAETQREMVNDSRRKLYGFALLSATIFVVLLNVLPRESPVFVLQFLIFGMATALFPATLLSIWKKEGWFSHGQTFGSYVTWSMIIGVLGGIAVFGMSILSEQQFDAYGWGPILTLLPSILVTLIGVFASNAEFASN